MIFNINLKSISEQGLAHFELGDGGEININLNNPDYEKRMQNQMIFNALRDAEERGILISYSQLNELINNIQNFKFV